MRRLVGGRVAEVAARRQAALDGAYAAHPERFPNGAPTVPLPPAVVTINPIVTETVEVEGVVAVATGDAGTPSNLPPPAHVLPALAQRVTLPPPATHAVAT